MSIIEGEIPIEEFPYGDAYEDELPTTADNSNSEPWPDPVPLDHVGDLPPFPLEILPDDLRYWVRATATATQTPPDMAAMLALAVISLVLAKRYEVEVKPGWVEPLNLYIAVAMGPGERKSPVFRSAMLPVLNHEREIAVERSPDVQRWKAKHDVLEARYKKAVNAAKSGDGLDAHAAEELAIELAALKLPSIPRSFADDVTAEKLAVLLSEQGGRIGIFSPEGGIFEIMSGRYSDGVPNLDLLLKGHSADYFRQDRIKREPIVVRRPAITMGLALQPSVFEGLASKRELRGRGLLARFLYSMPTSMVGQRNPSPPPVHKDIADAYSRRLQKLMAGEPSRDEYGEIEPTVLKLDAASLDAVTQALAEMEKRLGPGSELEPMADFAMKHVGSLVRIGAILALWEGVGSNFGDIGNIGLNRFLLEGSISNYLLSHAKAAYACMGADPALPGARRVLNWVQAKRLSRFTKRDAWQGCKGSFKSTTELDKPLQMLVEHGYLREAQPERREGAGRPSGPHFLSYLAPQNSQYPQKG